LNFRGFLLPSSYLKKTAYYVVCHTSIHTSELFKVTSCLEYLHPRALILLKTWRYINRLLTYLLTYMCRTAKPLYTVYETAETKRS